MTAQSAIPLKWYVPFATGDSSRVEIPVTSSDATRASQTLGFPPLTMQPPAVGGVPPQGEDFNGAMNQVARICWWVLNGGGWPFDSTFATNSNINGYPNGATLQSADFLGQWINTVDNNQINPDTVGTNWVPGFQYGATAITGKTGGTTTLTPLQAAKLNITVSGTLASAQTLILPNWIKDWSITNNTTGAFTLIVKTAAGSGVTIPQNGAPTAVSGDGTNINQPAQNIAPGTSGTHAMTVAQAAGVVGAVRNLFAGLFAASTSLSITADEVIVESALGGIRYCLPNFNKTINLATTGAGGMDIGSAPVSGYVALYAIYNPTTQASALLATNATSAVASNVYSGANMPSGYTASGLVSVWQTNASSQFQVGIQRDRRISFPFRTLYSSTSIAGTITPLNIASAVPMNAVRVGVAFGVGSATTAQSYVVYMFSTSGGFGQQQVSGYAPSGGATGGNGTLDISSSQTVYYQGSPTSGATYSLYADWYEF